MTILGAQDKNIQIDFGLMTIIQGSKMCIIIRLAVKGIGLGRPRLPPFFQRYRLHKFYIFLYQWCIRRVLCHVYTCRFDNQVPNEKLV